MNNSFFITQRRLAAVAVVLIAAAQIDIAKAQVAPKARVFRLSQVRLTDGYARRAQETNSRYLMALDTDRLLHNFRVTAGLPSKAAPLGGWEAPSCGLRGHFVGHYLSACAQTYASTGDIKFKKLTERMIAELAKCQAELGAGYLSAFPAKAFDILEDRCDSGVWAPYYTIHKIMAGLLDVHILCENKQALAMLEKMADYFKKRTDALPASTIEKMLRCDKCNPVNEYGGMSDVLHDLHAATGKTKYLEFAHIFDRDWFLGPLMKGRDNLTNLHCNTHIPIVLGAARHYELTGKTDYRRAVEFFWERVAGTRSYATGNCSGPAANPTRGTSRKSEHWGLPNKLAETLTGGECESCAGHNMLKVTAKLFSWTTDPKYADFAERLYFNTVLNQQNPDTGMFIYHQPLGSPAKKRFGRTCSTFTCCYGTGVEAFAELAKDIYFHNDDTLWVNLYAASELNWKTRGLRIVQTTRLPETPSARLVVHTDKPAEMTVNLRIPYWIGAGAEVKVNGEPERRPVKAGSFYSLRRKWKNGDRLDLSLPMGLHLHTMPDDKNLAALMFGPIVLAALTDGKLTCEAAPTELLASVKPVKGRPLNFILKSPGESLTFKPLHRIKDEPYGVYIQTAARR